MKIFKNAFEAGDQVSGAAATIGKFDGIHLGHQTVIRRVLDRAKALRTHSLVITFDPNPEQYLFHGAYRAILPLERNLELIAALGVDAALVLPFNGQLSCQAPEAFARDILSKALRVREVCVGQDFCFGKDRAGRADTLACLGRELDFAVHVGPLLPLDGEKVGASKIRHLLREGHKQEAERYLGRRF
ncbi:MAG: FAD synthetase family protein [Elusimicrobia bacterium]|nr:FAD synthetase family protein [Elusimicrobiota bacterium]